MGINHVGLTVSDIKRSFNFYQKLFGVKKGWLAGNKRRERYSPRFSERIYQRRFSRPRKGVITHFSVAVDHIDTDCSKLLADKINSELPDAKARAAFQATDGVSTVNLVDPDGFHVQISPKDGR